MLVPGDYLIDHPLLLSALWIQAQRSGLIYALGVFPDTEDKDHQLSGAAVPVS